MNSKLQTQFDSYISYCIHTKRLRPRTVKGYKEVFRHFSNLMPELNDVGALKHEVLDTFFACLQTRKRKVGKDELRSGIKASTVRTYVSKLHSFFDWLCVRGFLKTNPVATKHLPQTDHSDRRALEKTEIEKMLGSITQNSINRFLFKRDIALIQILLFCGLRKTELLSLKLMDIDLHHKIIRVNGATSKSRFTRKLPISTVTAMHIEDYLAERRKRRYSCEYLWVSNNDGSRFTEHGLKHWVEKLKKHSGVTFHVHRFRHTFACMLGNKNVSAVKIQKLLGHTDLRMTQSYLRSMGVEDVRDSIQLLSLDNM